MPQYMIVYKFEENHETIRNSTLIWTEEELEHAVSIICKQLRGRVEIYTRYTDYDKQFYKYSRTVEHIVKGGK